MRHGEAESNATNIISTRVENPTHLTEKGKIQSEKTAQKLSEEKIDIIFSSDFIRTTETAEIIAANIGIAKEKKPRLSTPVVKPIVGAKRKRLFKNSY